MPLANPEGRTLLTSRSIECAGYECPDGLFDIEGRLTDLAQFPINSQWRTLSAGQPVHEMHLRLRIDSELVIRAVETSMDSVPYPFCQGVKLNVQRLVGLKIAGGFKKQVRDRIGHTEGCTHLLTLIDVLSTVAIRTLAGKGKRDGVSPLKVFGARDPSRPPLLDTCLSYAASSPVVESLFPEHYRPRQHVRDDGDAQNDPT